MPNEYCVSFKCVVENICEHYQEGCCGCEFLYDCDSCKQQDCESREEWDGNG